jgi:hypothetical protein
MDAIITHLSDSASAVNSARGFGSFRAFKAEMGPAGPGMDWHHVVAQTTSNVSRFGPQAIHNSQNLMRLDVGVHRKVSGFYHTKQSFTDGQRVYPWLAPQSFEEQTQFGLDTLRRLGVIP